MFRDRTDAGRRLARATAHLRGPGVVVVGLPRGGVPVALPVAQELGAPLDVIIVRRLGVPSQPEVAMGAIGEDGVRVVNGEVVRMAGITPEQLAAVEARERGELEKQVRKLRRGRARVPLAGRVVIVVDDGIATGSTARAACLVARAEGAARVVVAVPVAPPDAVARLAGIADEFIAVDTPAEFTAIGPFYADFGQVRNREVADGLRRAPTRPVVHTTAVEIPAGATCVRGVLAVPQHPVGLVLFAHGTGSGRHSPRNERIAATLTEAGLATLVFDLLTAREAATRANVYDVDLLAERLVDATGWARDEPALDDLPLGLFGASTGAAAALHAAATMNRSGGARVAAVVCRAGRPDLVEKDLPRVTAPTLLVVGSRDGQVLKINRRAVGQLGGEAQLEIVDGASHLFEEPGALDTAAALGRDWLLRWLPVAAGGPAQPVTRPPAPRRPEADA